jgi:hypothetical protein
MPFNLLMKRKVFAKIQVMCDEYEDKFGESVATASVVNVLLAEALIARGLIPEDFIRKEYRCANPIEQGFTASARQEKKPLEVQKEKSELERVAKNFSMVLDQWAVHPQEWREIWLKKAETWKDKVPAAKLVLALARGKGGDVFHE